MAGGVLCVDSRAGPSALFFLTAAMLLILAFRPAIKVYDTHLEIGKRIIPWQDVRRVDRTRLDLATRW